ncbi:MazG nucleotide pyrophosphohydrolase domain-containing protein [Corynebacterium urinipleomorphum]|uniref:MazG nucleotide pyrophosphohydrolase domain-containing protein n=1 Tax=Corynebacterium urinipleomorphum TaxID=1852380 RepID=UPI000B35B419|nr:MazG nucleotide pyrophosphohydrolase domain-containing protein [Corynebacterium urinipleomorphum]
MTILVLDPRWPDMIPLAAAPSLAGPLTYTDEVPVSVRWNLGDIAATESHDGTLVTTDPSDPVAQKRIAAGERVIEAPSLADPLFHAQSVMRAARTRGEWEMAQTHETLIEYLEQESGELIDAIRNHHPDDSLKKELSDLLLQVLFHAEIASRRGAFSFPDVAQAFVDKMRNRAPYLFDGSTGIVPKHEQDRLWSEGKKREKNSS